MAAIKPEYHVASFSGGKDSTAMVLHMIERGDHLDEVVFCDTTMEFPAMLRHVEKVKKVIEAEGIKFTTLRAEHDFEYYLVEHLPKRKEDSDFFGKSGYGWPGVFSQWCTKALKQKLFADYFRDLRQRCTVIQYIGIAADEDYRLERQTNQNPNHRHPLRDWGWTEAQALEYCKAMGYDWEGLYDQFNRVSCWCCPLQPLSDLRTLRTHHPELWQELQRLDRQQCKPFKGNRSVEELDKRFALEDALSGMGESINNRAFHQDLKRLLAEEVSVDNIIKERQKEGESL